MSRYGARVQNRASDWLKAARNRAGLPKQEALATALGVTRSTVANWESGRGGPSPATVPLLASLLGVPQSEVAEVFHIRLTGDLPMPVPPWAGAMMSRLDRIIVLLEAQNGGSSKDDATRVSG